MHAEAAYVFRHALLRDAAYELQPVSDRALLHLAAADALEPMATAVGVLDQSASEIADHISLARQHQDSDALKQREHSLCRRAARFAEKHFRNSEAQRLWLRAGELAPDNEKLAALASACNLAVRYGPIDAARALVEDALNLARAHRDRLHEGKLTLSLAVAHHFAGDLRDAETYFDAAHQLLAETGDPGLEAQAIGALGAVLDITGRVEQAEALYTRAADLYRRAGDRAGEGSNWCNLGLLYHNTARNEQAHPIMARAIQIGHDAGHFALEALARGNMALIETALGRRESALQLLDQALVLQRRIGDRRNEGVCLTNLAYVHEAARDYAAAERTYLHALSVHREMGNLRFEGVVLGNLGGVMANQQRLAESEQYLARAVEIHRKVNHTRFLAVHLANLACVYAGQGKAEPAKAAWQEAEPQLAQAGLGMSIEARRAEFRRACADGGFEPLV